MATKKNMPKWMRGLDGWMRKHLAETCDGKPTLRAFRANREGQRESGHDCIDCRLIANRLGLEA